MQQDLVLRAASRKDGVVTIHAAGVIDAHTLDKFESALAKAMEIGARSIVLDCEEVRYVNSSGFGELIRYHDRLRERGGLLVLARVPPRVGIILEMLGLKSLMPVVASLEEGLGVAAKGVEAVELEVDEVADAGTGGGAGALRPLPGVPAGRGFAAAAPEAAHPRVSQAQPILASDDRIVLCAACDTRVRVAGDGRWACPACGAPFTATAEGGVAFDWSRADADATHMTFDISPRTLAGFAGMLEGILIERRVSHARMRRFAREAAHVCHLLCEHAFAGDRKGPLHVLVLAGPQRLHLRIVDKGKALGKEAERVFATQARLFLDFSYHSQAPGLNLTEFAFAYAGSGVFVA